MTNIPPRPRLFSTLLRAASDALDAGAYRRLVPIWLLVGGCVGGVVAWFMPVAFWSEARWDVPATVYTGFLAFDGLLLAFGWSAFSKIYEIISSGAFAVFLRRNGLLAEHLAFIDLVHGALIVSAFISGCALVMALLPLPLFVNQVMLGAVVAFSFWGLVKALSAVQMMNQLIWEVAHTEEDGRGKLKPVPSSGQGS